MELALSLENWQMKADSFAQRKTFIVIVAEKNEDVQLIDFVETEFLAEQVEAIRKISEYVAQLRTFHKGHGAAQQGCCYYVMMSLSAVESGVMLSGALIVAV